jgi:hypothetical protein
MFTQVFIMDKATGNILPAEYGSSPALLEAKLGKLNSAWAAVLKNDRHKYESVNVHFCTEDTMPDFEGEDVLLSIDGDALSLSGFDTTDHIEINRETKELHQAFSALLQKLADCHAVFTVVDLAFSIKYLQPDDVQTIEEIFNFIMEHTPQRKDNILS